MLSSLLHINILVYDDYICVRFLLVIYILKENIYILDIYLSYIGLMKIIILENYISLSFLLLKRWFL